jgi:O-antigen ligase
VVNGGVGRISAWSYEPAFWAFHLEAAIAVALGDALAGRRRFRVPPALPLAFLLVQLVLVNARAGYVSIPLVVLLVLRANRRARGFDRNALRFVQVGLAVLGIAVVLALTTGSDVVDYAGSRLASVTDTNEAASNAVRLQLYDTAVDLASDRPLLGYGPGGAGAELVERVPLYRGLSPFGVPANNIVLQLVLDAGLGTLPLYAGLLGVLWWHARKAPDRDTRILLAALLALLLVNGALVSFMWDMRLWVVLGLAYASARTRILDPPPVRPAPPARRAPPR